MKQNSVLPERWKLRVNNIEDIKPYLIEKYREVCDFIILNPEQYFLYSDSKTGFCYPNYYSIVSHNEYEEITLEQFKEYFYNKNMKPKPFIIYGKTHQLQSIWEDLKEIGYKSVYSNENVCINAKSIRTNTFSIVSSKDGYKYMYLNHILGQGNDIEFHLPQDYQKALDYCTEALKDSNWEEEYKIGEWLYYEDKYYCGIYGIFRYNGIRDNIYDSLESYQIHNADFIEHGEEKTFCSKNKVKGKATKEQIEEVLRKVAEYKGYKEGVYIQSLKYNQQENLLRDYKPTLDTFNNLWKGHSILYQDGKWAKIVKEIEIAGFIAKFDGEVVKFGCQQFSYEEIKAIYKLLKQVGNYKTVSLTIDDQKITLELLEKIMDRIVN